MNAADVAQAPPEYQNVAWIADACKLLMGVGWMTNYIGMIYKSFQEKTYCMSLMPLCCNFAWELVYAVLYPFGSGVEQYVLLPGLVLNGVVMYTAVRFGRNEWAHAPLVQRNLHLIFTVCVVGWMSAHLALAAQFGPTLAQAWSAYGCHLLLSVGAICQLIGRGNSRGASYFLWYIHKYGSYDNP